MIGQAFGGNAVTLNVRNRWNFGPISIGSKKYQGPYDNKVIELDAFSSLDIELSLIEMEIKQGDGYRLELIDVPQGTLKLEVTGSSLRIFNTYQKNMDYGINDFHNKVILTIPQQELEELKIDLSMGKLDIRDIQAKSIEIEGSMTMIRVDNTVSQEVSIESSMADVRFSGEVLGDIRVVNSMANVDIKLSGKADDYSYELSNSMGSVSYDRRSLDGFASEMSGNDDAPYRIMVENSMGNIDVRFE